MKIKILIVEDQFIEANDIQLMLTKTGYDVCGIARSVDAALKLLEDEKPDFVLVDIFLKGKLTGIDLAGHLNEMNIPFMYISANSNEETLAAAKKTQPYGFIVKPFREKDLLVAMEIARYRWEHGMDAQLRREQELLQQLEQIPGKTNTTKEQLLQLATTLQQHIPFDMLTLGYDKPLPGMLTGCSFLRVGFDEYQVLDTEKLATVTRTTLTQLGNPYARAETADIICYNAQKFAELATTWPMSRIAQQALGMQSCLQHTLLVSGQSYNCYYYSRKPDTYHAGYPALLHRLQHQLEKSIGHIHGSHLPHTTQMRQAHPTSITGNVSRSFDGVIGNSAIMMNVFDKITQVAPYDTSVLLLGESGTGKERIADCIHQHSERREKPFVKVNCAALPPTLIESELFGHEKGSFTGAIGKRAGKFQQAQGGTIFLDEIGEMSMDMQVKLLRVLQEKEVEPIGASSPVKIDVRIIAATNRNLEKEVAEGRFRLDLYYRLNVFPIQLPPLRERKDDIHSLALHFISLYNKKAGKKVEGISDKVLQNLLTYPWPGNIRELENMIERSVLLARSHTIENMDLPISTAPAIAGHHSEKQVKTIDEIERDHILSVLAKTNGKIWGAGGAAELLNIPPTTLSSKMKKLGIRKGFGL